MTTLAAQPFDYQFDLAKTALVIIDMQRDFIEPGGFGESLGNDVSLLAAIVPACRRVLDAWRGAGVSPSCCALRASICSPSSSTPSRDACFSAALRPRGAACSQEAAGKADPGGVGPVAPRPV